MQAAERREPAHVARLRELAEVMAAHKDGNDEWVRADLAFHRVIAEAAGNTLMLFLMEALVGIMEDTIRALHVQRDVRDANATLKRHIAIADAIETRDPEQARRAMQAHFDATQPVVLRILEEKHRQVWA